MRFSSALLAMLLAAPLACGGSGTRPPLTGASTIDAGSPEGEANPPSPDAGPAAVDPRKPVLAATPPMGWNDWAHYQCWISEQIIGERF